MDDVSEEPGADDWPPDWLQFGPVGLEFETFYWDSQMTPGCTRMWLAGTLKASQLCVWFVFWWNWEMVLVRRTESKNPAERAEVVAIIYKNIHKKMISDPLNFSRSLMVSQWNWCTTEANMAATGHPTPAPTVRQWFWEVGGAAKPLQGVKKNK